MQVLNLDDLAKVDRVVNVGGKRYEIKEMSVEGFIEYTQMSAKVQKDGAEGLSLRDNIEMSIKTILLAMPDCPAEVLNKFNIAQLTALVQFINGELDKDIASGAVTIEGGDQPEKKS